MHSVVEFLDAAVTSPWFYLALFAVAAIDAFFPAVPSESMVITGGVYAAAADGPHLALVVALAAAGAFLGDHVSYGAGRGPGGRLMARPGPGTRRHGAMVWARRTLDERGGLILVVARYVPGGRTAVTLTMGAVRWPLRWFTAFAAVAAVSWALYGAFLGFVGGAAFEHDPVRGVALGIGLALTLTVVVETVRFTRRRRSARATAPAGALRRPGGAAADVTGEDSAGPDTAGTGGAAGAGGAGAGFRGRIRRSGRPRRR